MKNISRKKDDFQNSEEAAVARINDLSAAIQSAPENTINLISHSIETETNDAVKGWLIRFREAFQPLANGGANV